MEVLICLLKVKTRNTSGNTLTISARKSLHSPTKTAERYWLALTTMVMQSESKTQMIPIPD